MAITHRACHCIYFSHSFLHMPIPDGHHTGPAPCILFTFLFAHGLSGWPSHMGPAMYLFFTFLFTHGHPRRPSHKACPTYFFTFLFAHGLLGRPSHTASVQTVFFFNQCMLVVSHQAHPRQPPTYITDVCGGTFFFLVSGHHLFSFFFPIA